jgi:hypothetical protein
VSSGRAIFELKYWLSQPLMIFGYLVILVRVTPLLITAACRAPAPSDGGTDPPGETPGAGRPLCM